MSEYPEFVNRFSVVDVISYFAPGALYSLYTHYLMVRSGNNVFLEAIDAVFQGSILARAVCFCVISYVVGMMLSEVSYWICTVLGKVFGKYIDRKSDNGNLGSISMAEKLRKQQLFQCFYELFRSLSVAIPVLLIQSAVCGFIDSVYLLLFIAAEIICIIRAVRFRVIYLIYQKHGNQKTVGR